MVYLIVLLVKGIVPMQNFYVARNEIAARKEGVNVCIPLAVSGTADRLTASGLIARVQQLFAPHHRAYPLFFQKGVYAVDVVCVKNVSGCGLAPFAYPDGIGFIMPDIDPCRLKTSITSSKTSNTYR